MDDTKNERREGGAQRPDHGCLYFWEAFYFFFLCRLSPKFTPMVKNAGELEIRQFRWFLYIQTMGA